jgi:hypothetical protein
MPTIAPDPATGTATVTIACRLPHGLKCQVHRKESRDVPVLGGGYKKEEYWAPTGEEFIINGNAHPQNEAPLVPMSRGFALTRGVPKHLWDAWLAQYKSLPAVVTGAIFAHERESKVVDEAKEKMGVRTGLERIDPNNLPAEFNRRVRTADEQIAKPQPSIIEPASALV